MKRNLFFLLGFLPAFLLTSVMSPAQRKMKTIVIGGCDESLWNHVYNPDRLKIMQRCVTVTGTIVDATATRKTPNKDGLRHEADGDAHGWLKLDPGQDKFVNDGNRTTEGGNLVYEPVCMFKVKQKDAVSACAGYKSNVKVPPVGTRVRMTGSWVQDMEKAPGHAQHFEIHPVTSIVPVKK